MPIMQDAALLAARADDQADRKPGDHAVPLGASGSMIKAYHCSRAASRAGAAPPMGLRKRPALRPSAPKTHQRRIYKQGKGKIIRAKYAQRGPSRVPASVF
jgi:hypothetical protein